jgi:hypothetical protein
VLIIEVDVIDAEPSQRRLGALAHVFGPAVDAEERPVLAAHVAELGRNHRAVALAAQRLPEQLLVDERPIHVGRVEEVDAELERTMDGRDRLGVVARTVELGHAHAAEPDRRYLKALPAELAFFHALTLAPAETSPTGASCVSSRRVAQEDRKTGRFQNWTENGVGALIEVHRHLGGLRTACDASRATPTTFRSSALPVKPS